VPRGRALTTVALMLAAGVTLLVIFLGTQAGREPPDSGNERTAGAEPRALSSEGRTSGGTPESDGRFQDVTERAGIGFTHVVADGRMDTVIESVGCGAVWFDADGDGDLDLYLLAQGYQEGVSDSSVRPGPNARQPCNRLYRNDGKGSFEDVTARGGVGDTGFGFSAAAADYDNDGDTDLYVLNMGANRLYRNRGDGTFEDVTAAAGVAGDGCSVAGTFFDANGDGLLDLYVGNYLTFDPAYRVHYAPDGFPGPLAFEAQEDRLYLNRGDGTFEDRTAAFGMRVTAARSMGVVAVDLDDDGRSEVFVANDLTANHLFRSTGPLRFEEAALQAGVAYGFQGEATGAMAAATGDFDGDGKPDFHVTDTSYGSLYRNRGGLLFEDRARKAGTARASAQWVSWGGGFLDYDRDGNLDLFLVNGDLHYQTGRPDLLLRNVGDGTFDDASGAGGRHFRRSLLGRAGCLGDFDDDGASDVLVTTIGGPVVLLRGRAPADRHWIGLKLEATRGVLDAYGARVVVTARGRRYVRVAHARSGYLCQGDPRMLFGLGAVTEVESIEVRWPGGRQETFSNLAVDRYHQIVEGRGGP